MLELPDDYFWERVQSHNGSIGEGYFRQMMFHPKTPEEMKAAGGVQMHGHQGEATQGTARTRWTRRVTC